MNEIPSLDTLSQVIPDHEIQVIQDCLLVLRENGIIVDMTDFVSLYLKDGNYEEDEHIGLHRAVSSTFEKEEKQKMLKRRGLIDSLDGERTMQEVWSFLVDHEVWYLGYVYHYALGLGASMNPVKFIDSVAKKRGYSWDEKERKYTNTGIVLE